MNNCFCVKFGSSVIIPKANLVKVNSSMIKWNLKRTKEYRVVASRAIKKFDNFYSSNHKDKLNVPSAEQCVFEEESL